jgi:hypothetical protein
MYIQLPSGTAVSGTTITAPIYLGTSAIPCSYLYGYSFTVNYDLSMIVPGSVSINLTNNWLGNNTNELMLTKDNYAAGKIDAAVVRYDKTQIASGYGQIGTITFTLQYTASGNLHLGFSPSAKALSTTMYGSTVAGNLELFRPINLMGADLSVTLGVASYVNDNNIQTFPNPANDVINVMLNNTEVTEIKLVNVLGEVIYSNSGKFTNSIKINTAEYAKGVYTLSCKTNDGIVVKKVSIVH